MPLFAPGPVSLALSMGPDHGHSPGDKPILGQSSIEIGQAGDKLFMHRLPKLGSSSVRRDCFQEAGFSDSGHQCSYFCAPGKLACQERRTSGGIDADLGWLAV